MEYVLSEKQINEIIKKGKFDKDEYGENIASFYYTAGELIERYSERNSIPLLKNKNELYSSLTYLDLYDSLWDELDDQLMEEVEIAIKELKAEINEGKIL